MCVCVCVCLHLGVRYVSVRARAIGRDMSACESCDSMQLEVVWVNAHWCVYDCICVQVLLNCLQDFVAIHRDLHIRNSQPPYKINCSLCYPQRPEKTFDGTDLI